VGHQPRGAEVWIVSAAKIRYRAISARGMHARSILRDCARFFLMASLKQRWPTVQLSIPGSADALL